MVAIKAERTPEYKTELFLAPLDKVANVEKEIPAGVDRGWKQDFG